MGLQGPRGLQGAPGKDCEKKDCCDRCYLSVYSTSDQNLTANGDVNDFAIFEHASAGTPDCFDWSLAATTGQIKVLKSGAYVLQWVADGQLAPPFPAPVPVWALGLYVNGVFLPGTGIAGFSQSPDDEANCLTQILIVNLLANDVLMLRNIGTFPIFLTGGHPELVVPVTSASLSINKASV
jgi:hypothetical protein